MKIYLDIVYLLNSYLGLLCTLSFAVLCNQVYPLKKVTMVSFVWGLGITEFYLTTHHVLFWLMVLLVVYLLHPKHYFPSVILWLFIYISYLETFQLFMEGFLVYRWYLVVGMSFAWLKGLLFGTIIIILYLGMVFSYKEKLKKQSYYYPISLKKDHTQFSYHGFLDTGNNACIHGLPVIFMKKVPFFMDKYVYLAGIGKKQGYKATEAEIYLNERWQKVYICELPDLDDEVLLSLALF